MPSAEQILHSLAIIANDWKSLAMMWHAYFAVILAAVLLGWRPSMRVIGALMIAPLASVSLLAWANGNPFNGTAFILITVLLAWVVGCVERRIVRTNTHFWTVIGTALIGFAWIYPDFLDAESSLAYLYASPLGLLPCPTLSMNIGIAMILDDSGDRLFAAVLGIAGLFYGVFGGLHLGVIMDWALAAGALCLLGRAVLRKPQPGNGAHF